MRTLRRRLAGVAGNMAAGLLLINRVSGEMILELEGAAPNLLVKNAAEPRLELAEVILMLFASSLATLFIGYVVDATRFARK